MPSGQPWESISGQTRMERARGPRIVPGMERRTRRVTFAAVLLAIVAAGCGTGETPPSAGVRADGFPTGVFEKSFVDPDFGPIRLYWVFDANGDWAEVPEATAGQRIFPDIGPSRGHYTVDGDLLSIKVDKPIVFDNQHHWRLEGDHLTTTYEDSDLPQDADFFAMLDRQPWVRVP